MRLYLRLAWRKSGGTARTIIVAIAIAFTIVADDWTTVLMRASKSPSTATPSRYWLPHPHQVHALGLPVQGDQTPLRPGRWSAVVKAALAQPQVVGARCAWGPAGWPALGGGLCVSFVGMQPSRNCRQPGGPALLGGPYLTATDQTGLHRLRAGRGHGYPGGDRFPLVGRSAHADARPHDDRAPI